MKPPLIIIAGPTATGKSAAAVALALEIGGEVVSADSMQVYRGLDIGSAKVTASEMRGVPHHLIDVLAPEEDFNVKRFQEMAKAAMSGIYARGHVPILCGGTGFYIQSILYDIQFTEEDTDQEYRAGLERIAREQGAEALYEMLRAVDPDSCAYIHAHNVKRVIRALEYYHETGEPISKHNAAQRAKEAAYRFCYFVLTDARERLYARIDTRVDRMMEQGLLDEVRRLKDDGVPRMATAMQGLGYKEIYDHLLGLCTLEQAVYRIKQGSRHFAKRQLTWYRREPKAIWLDRSHYDEPDAQIVQEMRKFMLAFL